MKQWFKNPLAYLAMLISALTGTFFILGAVPGFNQLPKSTDQLQMTIVDQDQTPVTKQISSGLKQNVPFKHVTASTNLANAKTRLSNRTDAIALQIPTGFTKTVESGKQPQLHFYVNDSNGMLQNNVTRSAITGIQAKLAAQLTSGRVVLAMAKQIGPNLAKQASIKAKAAAAKQGGKMTPAKAAAMQKQIKQTVMKQTKLQAQRAAKQVAVTPVSRTTHLNKMASNYQYQMGPMFINIGLYLGIMIMSLILTLMFMGGRYAIGKRQALLMAQINGLLGTIIGPLVATLVLRCFIRFSGRALVTLWGSEWLFALGVFELTFTLALLLGGVPSVIVQFPLMAAQAIAGGAIVPRQAMNGFYQWLSYHAPMYQGVYLTFNALYGGGRSGAYMTSLWLLIILGLAATIVIAAAGYRGRRPTGFSKLIKL